MKLRVEQREAIIILTCFAEKKCQNVPESLASKSWKESHARFRRQISREHLHFNNNRPFPSPPPGRDVAGKVWYFAEKSSHCLKVDGVTLRRKITSGALPPSNNPPPNLGGNSSSIILATHPPSSSSVPPHSHPSVRPNQRIYGITGSRGGIHLHSVKNVYMYTLMHSIFARKKRKFCEERLVKLFYNFSLVQLCVKNESEWCEKFLYPSILFATIV